MEDRFYSEGSGEHTAELIIPSVPPWDRTSY